MMSDYFITEFINIDCDENGFLETTFRLEDDSLDYYRSIESDEYYYWVLENFEYQYDSDDFVDDEWDATYNGPTNFTTFSDWLSDYHNEDTVLSFLKETYPLIEDLPSVQSQKK
jgi:hypothetical protein